MSGFLSDKQKAFLDQGILFEFLLPVVDKFFIEGRGTVVTGSVVTGFVKANENVEIIKPDGTMHEFRVIGIERNKKLIDVATKGDTIGMLFKVLCDGVIDIGDIVVSVDAGQHDMDATCWGYQPGEIPQSGGARFFKADEHLRSILAQTCREVNPDIKVFEGRVISGDQFIADKETKNHIKEVCSPVCVEMEGAGIAHACYLNNVPYLILRAISDMADETVEQTYSFNEDTAAQISAGLLLELIKNL